MEKISVLASALVLVVAMITTGVFNNNGIVVAKSDGSDDGSKDSGSSGSSSEGNSGGDDGGSGSGSSSSSSSSGSNNGNDDGSGSQTPTKDDPNKIDDGTIKDGGKGSTEQKSDMPIVPTTNPKSCVPEGHDSNCNPTEPKSTINFGCHFHPNDDRCAPAIPGQCPGGFASNEKGNCHPIGPCPPGFSRHDDDESGQCFHNGSGPGNFCHFHNCVPCHSGFVFDHDSRCVNKVFIDIVHHNSGSSSGSSHSLSAKCFDVIKIAWIGKIHRGENHDVDKIIDDCLNV